MIEPSQQIEAARDLLKKQKVSEPLIEFFATLVPALCERLIADFAASYKKLADIAKKDGTGPDQLQVAKFGFAVKFEITNPRVVKAETNLTFNEPHKLRGAIMEEMDQGQLFGMNGQPGTDGNENDGDDDDEKENAGVTSKINKPVNGAKPAKAAKRGKKAAANDD